MTPIQLKRVVELVAEIEEIMQVSTSFIYGDSDTDIRGILLADMEMTDAILGQVNDTKSMN
jgi:hypothetical protein